MQLITVKDVCSLLSVKKSTVYEWVALGLIPHVRINGCLRFDTAELSLWVERCKNLPRKEGFASRILGRVIESAAGGVAGGAVKAITDK